MIIGISHSASMRPRERSCIQEHQIQKSPPMTTLAQSIRAVLAWSFPTLTPLYFRFEAQVFPVHREEIALLQGTDQVVDRMDRAIEQGQVRIQT